MKQYATYLRVSTQKQGKTMLGIEAQRKMCQDFVSQNAGNIKREFMDIESGTHRDRKGLQDAIMFCKKNDCPLVIAKLDRLARDVEFCFKVINTGIEIHFCDMPTINTLLLGVFASVAQYERELTSDRTKKALAVKKANGCKLGAANETFKANRAKKDKQTIIEEYEKMANTKRERFQTSKKATAFLRILQQVFPDATKNEDPRMWDWKSINTKGDSKVLILNMMKTMRDVDETGHLWHKWDFDAPDETQQRILSANIASVRRSFTKRRYAE